jgi:hypothetical protein
LRKTLRPLLQDPLEQALGPIHADQLFADADDLFKAHPFASLCTNMFTPILPLLILNNKSLQLGCLQKP